jgi:hypothetical protein
VATKKERPVIVCTEYKGVFFGYAEKTAGDVITLRRARCCIYWSANVGGFMGLAEKGPNLNCKIGATADIELRKVTCVLEVSAAAEKAWSAAPCVF